MSSFVLAVKREMRNDAPADWIVLLSKIDGVELLGETESEPIQIEADEDTIARVSEQFKEFCHIEPVIVHEPNGDESR